MTILWKYVIIYTYLLLVMGVSFVVSKRTQNNEVSRNIVHICAGLGWILYRLLFPATIHPIIISCSFVILAIITTKMKIRFIERENGSLGTIYFTSSMLVMALLGYNSLLRFDMFGIAITCLSCGDAAANIIGSRFGTKILYKKKSVEGTIACFFMSALIMIILVYSFNIKLDVISICLLATLCAITELFSGDYDNIAITTILYTTSYFIFTHDNNIHLGLSLLIGIFMFGFAVKLKLLNLAASYMLFFFMFVLFYCGGIKCFISLMLIFSVIIIIEKMLRKKTDNIFQSMNKEYGVRNEYQLMANCLIAVIAIVIYGITKSKIFIVAFFTAIAETVGDSIASDVGVLSKSNPLDICTFKRVPKGVSGGISVLGTLSSICICLYAGLLYICIYEMNLYHFVVIVISALLGIIFDSILGSKIQAKYQCNICGKITEKERHCEQATILIKGLKKLDNTRVNWTCNMISCVVACLLMIMR